MENNRINLGGALLGEELDYVEKINIEFDEDTGRITHIGKGYDYKGKDLRGYVAIPPLVNAHAHTADFTFPEVEITKSLKELVGDPKSVKYEYFKKYRDKIAERIAQFLKYSKSLGIFTIVDFREEGIEGIKIALEADKIVAEVNHILLGRLDVFSEEELIKLRSISHGYGLPSVNSNSKDELAKISTVFSDKIRGAHVSETKRHYLRDDLEYLLSYYKPTLLIHGTNLNEPDFDLISDIPLVVCPRSNLWFSAGIPRIADAIEKGVKLLFGTDNGAWIDYNLWKDLELAYLLSRVQRPLTDFSKEILKGATTTAYKIFNLNYGVEEGKTFLVVLLKKDELSWAHNIYSAIVKRGSNLVSHSLGAIQNLK